MAKTGFTSLILVFSLALTACQSHHGQDRTDTPLVTSYKLIDDNREDEAIFVLDQEISRTQGDGPYVVSLKVAMASAYAHKAGFKVQKFANLFNVSKNQVDFSIKPAVHVTAKTPQAEAVDIMIQSLGSLLSSFRTIMDYYTAIPTVKPEAEKYLNFALRILNDLGDKLSPGQSLYRAVLNVVFLKNYLAAHVFHDGLAVDVDLSDCEIDFRKLGNSMDQTAKVGISITDDLIRAQPSKAEGLSKVRKQLADSVADLTLVMTSASILDDTSMLFTKSAIVQAGLRNLLQCHVKGPPTEAAAAVPH